MVTDPSWTQPDPMSQGWWGNEVDGALGSDTKEPGNRPQKAGRLFDKGEIPLHPV